MSGYTGSEKFDRLSGLISESWMPAYLAQRRTRVEASVASSDLISKNRELEDELNRLVAQGAIEGKGLEEGGFYLVSSGGNALVLGWDIDDGFYVRGPISELSIRVGPTLDNPPS